MSNFFTQTNGSGYIDRQLQYWRPGAQMSDLGKQVANLLSELFGGIYHLKNAELKNVDWTNEHFIEISVGWKPLSTYDYDDLTRLVFLAHCLKIRVQLSASTHNYMRWLFHKAPACPDLQDAVDQFIRLRQQAPTALHDGIVAPPPTVVSNE